MLYLANTKPTRCSYGDESAYTSPQSYTLPNTEPDEPAWIADPTLSYEAPDDFPVNEEPETETQVYDGRRKYSVLNKSDFEQIFYDYSQKLLEVFQSDTSLPETWKYEMIANLEKLKIKIENESPT